MANIDKLTLNGVQYTIVDSTVGTQIATATANYFDGAAYDSNSKRINFSHDGTVKAFVDATPFLVDGMIDSVAIQSVVTSYVIKDGETGESPLTPAQYAELSAADKEKYDAVSEQCLVITWNTDAGKQTVNIPLSAIFDPSNYYTKNETDTLLSAKANSSSLATVATSGDYDDLTNKPSIPAAQVQSDWNQADTTAVDYIKNKPNIPAGVVVDSALSTTSTNPVENRVITGALNNKANSADLATVATSGSYADLSNTPYIPTVTYDSQNTALVINTTAQVSE